MTEADWLIGDDPSPLERWVGRTASARKLRLFEVACCRRLLSGLRDAVFAQAVEVAEQYAEGTVCGPDVAAIRHPRSSSFAWVELKRLARQAARQPGGAERAARCRLLREVFGNPFRPVQVEPRWLAWNGQAVVALARVVYEEQRWEDLPLLADALEEAGCADGAVLAHARSAGPHVRGCWLLDHVLGLG